VRKYGAERFLQLYFACRPGRFEAECLAQLGVEFDALESEFWAEVERLALHQQRPQKSALLSTVDKIKPVLVTIRKAAGKGSGAANDKSSRLVLGIVIDARGKVITNHSLIKEWEQCEVVLSDGRRLPAKALRADPDLDLSVLKVETARPLPFAEWGDSERINVGDFVLALSYPWTVAVDEPLTVIMGMIGGKVAGTKKQEPLFVVDTAIGPGCGPGPLMSTDGKLVGLVVGRDQKSRAHDVAVPSNRVRERLAEWSRQGHSGATDRNVHPTKHDR
jgi:S1-C subfamily serine protease